MTDPTTDFRALCAELVEYVERLPLEGALPLVDRTRAALSQPAPEPPTDEALLLLAAKAAGYERIASADDDYLSIDAAELVAFGRTVLARWGLGNGADPTPNRPPLWQVMQDAHPPGLTTPDRFWMYERDCFAAELRAIADWLRDLLLAEADRAEAGEQ
jgi:hypothetical protein